VKYRTRDDFFVQPGFDVTSRHVEEASGITNNLLLQLPAALYRSLDFKTTSAIVGSLFCESLAAQVRGIVNPIEKGHPDIVPLEAAVAEESQLRNYPQGLEIKTTIGNIEQGANLRAGEKRVAHMTGIIWQAHHRDVRELMGLTWDFLQDHSTFLYPGITGVFYSADLTHDDWGMISGTTGRNTKVSGMKSSGKRKMGSGWVLLVDDGDYARMFESTLGIPSLGPLK